MAGDEIKAYAQTIMSQGKMRHGALNRLYDEDSRAALLSGKGKGAEGYQVRNRVQYNNSQLKLFDYYANGTKRVICYDFNEKGDLVREALDFDIDGSYEQVIEYNCEYNKHGKLVSHEETTMSKIRDFLMVPVRLF